MSRLVSLHLIRPSLHKRVNFGFPCASLRQSIRFNSSRPPRPSDSPSSSQLPEPGHDRPPSEDTLRAEQDAAEELEANEPGTVEGFTYPNLMVADPVYDSAIEGTLIGRHSRKAARIILRNEPPIVGHKAKSSSNESDAFASLEEIDFVPMPKNKWSNLHEYPLVTRRVTQQTGKGKVQRMYCLIVMGNGNGLVGMGEGKHDELGVAQRKARIEALRNLDYVERFESRTIWTEMDTKYGATRVVMRPRPVGFGLHCNPNVHQVLKAAGVKDVSAKVWGSRNPINVIKATCRMIQSGNAPLSMGDGLGGKGRKSEAGSGMRSREAVERERGRKIVDGRTW